MQRILLRNTFWSLLNHLLSRGTLVLMAIILARALPSSDFAAYSYFQLTISMLGIYASLGLGQTATKFFAEVGHEVPGEPPKPLGTLFIISIIISVLAGLLVFFAPEWLLNADLNIPQWLMAAGVTVIALSIVPGGAMIGLEQFRAATVISFLHSFLLITAACWAVHCKTATIAMVALVLGTTVQVTGQSAIVLLSIFRKKISLKCSFSKQETSYILNFAGPMFIVSLMAASGAWIIGRIILFSPEGLKNFALYSIGLHWYSLALLLPGIISQVMLPRLIRIPWDNIKQTKKTIIYGINLSLITGVGISLIAVLFAPSLNSLYGSNYSIERFFIAAYMAATLPILPTNMFDNAILAKNGQWIRLKNTAVWFIVLLATAYFTTFHGFGAWVGSISFILANGILLLLAFISCRNLKSI